MLVFKQWSSAHLKNVNNCLNTNIYSYLETSSGTSYILHLNIVHVFNTSVNKTSVAAQDDQSSWSKGLSETNMKL